MIVDKLNKTEIKTLWVVDYYDGPLKGICRYKDKDYWFDVFTYGGWEEASLEQEKLILEEHKCNTKSDLLALDDSSKYNLTFNGHELFVYYDEMHPNIYISYAISRTYYLKQLSWWQFKFEVLLHSYFGYLKDKSWIHKNNETLELTRKAKIYYFIHGVYDKVIRKYMYKKIVGWF